MVRVRYTGAFTVLALLAGGAATLAMGTGTAFAADNANSYKAVQEPNKPTSPAQYTYNYGTTSSGQMLYARQPEITVDTVHGTETVLPRAYVDDAGGTP